MGKFSWLKYFCNCPKMWKKITRNLFNRKQWSQWIIMVLQVRHIQVTMSCYSSAMVMTLQQYFQLQNGLQVLNGSISQAFTQLFSTYWSFHIGWENVTSQSCTWVWTSGGWAARQHLYYAGACMLKYFHEHFSSRNYFYAEIFHTKYI